MPQQTCPNDSGHCDDHHPRHFEQDAFNAFQASIDLLVPDGADLFVRHQLGSGDVNRVHNYSWGQFICSAASSSTLVQEVIAASLVSDAARIAARAASVAASTAFTPSAARVTFQSV
jgi:hypothetical protein